MDSPLRKILQNRAHANTNREAGLSVYPTEEILGSMVPVRDFADFYSKRKVDLELVHASGLHDYCNTTTFSPQEKAAFQMGIDFMLGFFESAHADKEAYLREQQTKRK